MTKEEKRILDNLTQSTKRIETALIGDSELGIEGLVHEIGKNSKHRKRVNKAAWISAGTSAAGVGSAPWWDKIAALFH